MFKVGDLVRRTGESMNGVAHNSVYKVSQAEETRLRLEGLRSWYDASLFKLETPHPYPFTDIKVGDVVRVIGDAARTGAGWLGTTRIIQHVLSDFNPPRYITQGSDMYLYRQDIELVKSFKDVGDFATYATNWKV